MKYFIFKSLGFLLSELFLIIIVVFYFKSKDDIFFVSNSISYNSKVEFICQNLKKFKKAEIVIIGSSMSLNNLNAHQFNDSFGRSTINVASWGMKFSDFEKFEIWGKQVVININFTDLGSSFILKKNGYPCTESKIIEFGNIISDFNTYKNQYFEMKSYNEIGSEKYYTSLKYDSFGTVFFDKNGFDIIKSRWEEDAFLKHDITKQTIVEYVKTLKIIIDKVRPSQKVILSFSPNRRCFYTSKKALMVKFFGTLLNEKIPQIEFINLYDLNFSDNLYVDNSHFNLEGNILFTSYLINKIKNGMPL